jgi:hypothetical protein
MAQASRRSRQARPPERDDPPVVQGASLTVMTALREYKAEAQKARVPRLRQNKRNWDAFMGMQDWSHKQKGQSKEFLPKIAMAAEQIGAFIERGLTDFGDWFSVDLNNEAIMGDAQARKLMQYQLDRSTSNGGSADEDFAALMADAVKVALLGSLMILKVFGRDTTKHTFAAERGYQLIPQPDGSAMPTITHNLVRKQINTWQLVIDLIPPEDYLPDPTGRGLYEMHEPERDLWEVQEMADAGVYDPEVVAQIEEDYHQLEEQYYSTQEQDREARQAVNPGFRKRVVLLEFWGTLLDTRGRVAEKNVVCTMANNKYLIRPPEPNPFWHGERPFVTRPLLRVPFSTWHKALFDHAVDLNLALNELYNLMLDGGVASVWGIKQLRPEYLEDPRQVKDGIPQGETLLVKDGTPVGAKVLEQVATGQVPPDAMALFQATDLEFQQATQANALFRGQAPPKDITATAVVEAQQQSNTFFDGMIKDTEKLITKVLSLSWDNMMQFLDNADAEEIVAAIGERAALALAQMSPAERYEQLAGCKFKVSGLSTVLARVRDFQKLMSLMQAVGQNPLLLQAFMQRFSPQKIVAYLFKSLNIDPTTIEQDEQEQAQAPQMMQQLMQLMGQGEKGAAPMPMPAQAPMGNLPVERMPATAGGY